MGKMTIRWTLLLTETGEYVTNVAIILEIGLWFWLMFNGFPGTKDFTVGLLMDILYHDSVE